MSHTFTPTSAAPPATYTHPSDGDKITASSIDPTLEAMGNALKYLLNREHEIVEVANDGQNLTTSSTSFVAISATVGILDLDNAVVGEKFFIVACAQATMNGTSANGGQVALHQWDDQTGSGTEVLVVGATSFVSANVAAIAQTQAVTIVNLCTCGTAGRTRFRLKFKVTTGTDTLTISGSVAMVIARIRPS